MADESKNAETAASKSEEAKSGTSKTEAPKTETTKEQVASAESAKKPAAEKKPAAARKPAAAKPEAAKPEAAKPEAARPAAAEPEPTAKAETAPKAEPAKTEAEPKKAPVRAVAPRPEAVMGQAANRMGDLFVAVRDSFEMARLSQVAAFDATSKLNDATAGFVARRLKENAALAAKLQKADDIETMVAAQRAFAEDAMKAYADHFSAMSAECQKLLTSGFEPMTRHLKEVSEHWRDAAGF